MNMPLFQYFIRSGCALMLLVSGSSAYADSTHTGQGTVTLLVIGWSNHLFVLLTAAALAQYVGLLAERWFFFAQANHPQNLYYQAT